MGRTFALVFLSIGFASSPAFAVPSLVKSLIPTDFIYLNVANVSTLTQTVDMVMRTGGGITISPFPCFGQGAVSCPTTTECRNISSLRSLVPGQAVTICARTIGAASSNSPAVAALTLEVLIAEDRGAVQATAVNQCHGHCTENLPFPIEINGGRPF